VAPLDRSQADGVGGGDRALSQQFGEVGPDGVEVDRRVAGCCQFAFVTRFDEQERLALI